MLEKRNISELSQMWHLAWELFVLLKNNKNKKKITTHMLKPIKEVRIYGNINVMVNN